MKQILMIMLVMLPMMAFSSCSKDDEDDNTRIDSELIGSWETFTIMEGQEVKEVITFNANGSYTGEDFLVENGNRIFKQDDTYHIEGNKIYLTQSGYIEYSISNNTLTLTGKTGVLTFTRVK